MVGWFPAQFFSLHGDKVPVAALYGKIRSCRFSEEISGIQIIIPGCIIECKAAYFRFIPQYLQKFV